MGTFDAFRYDGKRALVVGGATGMGAAAAELVKDAGAEVVVMDRAEVTLARRQGHPGRPRRQGLDRRRRRRVRRAGARAVLVRRRGRRHARHRAHQLHRAPPHDRPAARRRPAAPRARPSASSRRPPGFGWQANLDPPERVPRRRRLRRAPRSGRRRTARPTTCGASWRSTPTSPARPSACSSGACASTPSSPAPPNTPLAQANKETWLSFGADYRDEVGIEASTPLEQAYPLVFLCSDAAAGVTGITMVTDAGYFSSGISGSFPPATGAVEFLSSEF